jgi:hypothetical protein
MSAFALNGNGHSVLKYRDMPPRAYLAARDTLVRLGFPVEGIVPEWAFSYQEAQRVKTNAMVFADPVQRTPGEYASITLYNASDDSVGQNEKSVHVLAHSTAPLHLLHNNDSFQLWGSSISSSTGGASHSIRVESGIAYDQLASVLHKYSADLKPERIIDVKQGREHFFHPAFREIEPFQLTLWALEITGKLLVGYFRQAVNQLRQLVPRNVSENLVPDIAVQLLGAMVLADTGVLGNSLRSANVTLDKLIEAASAQYPRYFITEHFRRYAVAVEAAYSLMRNISYAGFVPEMLSHLYVEAFGQLMRKKMGRYDTPYFLTRHIWDNIPVEFLPPEQRIVADMSCGWGSFLIAGHKRMSRLSDMRGKQMRDFLHGNDIDRFTARLAGLGLLISTSSDKWHLDDQGVDEWTWLDKYQPNIIVGNPPFAGSRKHPDRESHSEVESPTRRQKADTFLSRAIQRLAPGGYLAMIMPQSFTVAQASPWLRKQLLDSCDVFELWELPVGLFGDAMVRTCVLFAQKKRDGQQMSTMPVRVRTVQPSTLPHFVQSSIFTASSVVPNQSAWAKTSVPGASKTTHLMEFRLALPEAKWSELHARCVPLRERALVFTGAVVGKKRPWKDYPHPRRVPWLSDVRERMPRPFYIDYSNLPYIRYPNDLERPRKHKDNPKQDREQHLAGPKVVLASIPTTSWGARVKVAIERHGSFVSDSFLVITPLPTLPMHLHGTEAEEITLEVLAAVVGWKVSNAWILEHLKYPKLPSRAVKSIPFPRTLSRGDREALTEAVHWLERDAELGIEASQSRGYSVIDRILRQAYQLDDATYERLTILAEWDRQPLVTLDEHDPPQEQRMRSRTSDAYDKDSTLGERLGRASWQTGGFVTEVDAAQGTITLWLDGFDGVRTVPIHPAMPGWLLRPDAEFRVKIPPAYHKAHDLSSVTWAQFEPQGFTYLDDDELLEKLSSFVYAEGEG